MPIYCYFCLMLSAAAFAADKVVMLLPVPSCHSQLCAVCKHDHAAGYGMNMFQINDKRAMNGGKHALVQFLPYFIQVHVGLIFHPSAATFRWMSSEN